MSDKKVENYDPNLPVKDSNSVRVLFSRMIDRIKKRIEAIVKAVKEVNEPLTAESMRKKYFANPAKPLGSIFAKPILDVCMINVATPLEVEMSKVMQEQKMDKVVERLIKGKEASMSLSELSKVVGRVARDVDGDKQKEFKRQSPDRNQPHNQMPEQEIVFDQPEQFGPTDELFEKYSDLSVDRNPNRSRNYPRGARQNTRTRNHDMDR